MRHLARKPMPVLPAAPVGSLAHALASVPDRRQPVGWRRGRAPLPLVAVLQVSVAALLCGAQSLAAIAQWSRERLEDAPELLLTLGLPPGRTPSVATLHRLFKTLDVVAFERSLGQWLLQTGVQPSEAFAVDGETLRGATQANVPAVPGAHLVAVYAHQAQQSVAQVASVGKGPELAATQQALAQVSPAGRVVTADALATRAGGVRAHRGRQGRLSLARQREPTGPLNRLRGSLFPSGTRLSRRAAVSQPRRSGMRGSWRLVGGA